jgi:AraC-like DNA-binding protein
LLRAREALRNPHFCSVTEVAYMCGFSDLSHFSRDFSVAFGEKPSAARKWKQNTDSSSLKTVTTSQTNQAPPADRKVAPVPAEGLRSASGRRHRRGRPAGRALT